MRRTLFWIQQFSVWHSRRLKAIMVTSGLLWFIGFASAQNSDDRLNQIAIVEKDVMIPMRDGVKLATDIVRPRKEGKYPVILTRTPYRKQTPGAGAVLGGYALATQDTRGRFNSEGEFYAFADDAKDGYDTIAWLATQSWCNGNVGMVGGSYLGFTQLAAAMARPAALRCIFPTVPPTDFESGVLFYGGALRMELAQGWFLGQSWSSQRVQRKEVPADELARWEPEKNFQKWCWHLPLLDPGPIAVGGQSYTRFWQDLLTNWEKPGKWDFLSAAVHPDQVTVPTLVLGGFYDIFAQEDFDLLLALRKRGGSEASRKHSHLVMGPWVHGVGGPCGDVNFPAALSALAGLQEKWTSRWLKGEKNEVDSWPPIKFFLMGADKWVDTDTWPPKESRPRRFYFTGKTISEKPPATKELPSAFTYDPEKPVPTLGGATLLLKHGIQDYRANSGRADVLEFLGEPLDRDLTVVGRLKAHLFVSSSAPDTDFTVTLLDVRPDGYMANVQDGITRARYRSGRGKPRLLKPGQIVDLDVNLWSTAYVFKKGDRIGAHVSSSNFPRFDRNLNTADLPGRGEKTQTAENKVYHDPARASYVELPVWGQ